MRVKTLFLILFLLCGCGRPQTVSAINFGDIPVSTTEPSSVWEAGLGNPGTNGYILSSTTAGVRSWIAPAGGGGAPLTSTYVTQTPDATLTNELALSTLATGLLKSTTSTGALSIVTDNSTNWNTAYTERATWDGGSTNLNAANGRASLALDQVTNNAQTQAAIVPNTAPSAGQILIGNAAGTAYAKQSLTNASLSATGVLTGVANAALANSTINIATMSTALGASVTLDQILANGGTSLGATGLIKRTGANTLAIAAAGTDYLTGNQSISLTGPITGTGTTAIATAITNGSVTNAALQNSAITIAGTSTALGGSITQDTITGLSATGIVKRTAANTLAIAAAGTDYQAPLAATKVVMITTLGTSTYTPTSGVRALYVECIGPGGGGGGAVASASNATGGGGGGGGGYATKYLSGSIKGTYSVTIGTGGAGGTTAGGNGGNGSSGTSFDAPSVCTASVGTGGTGNATGATTAGFPAGGGGGGVGTVGDILGSGGDGESCLRLSGTAVKAGRGGGSFLNGGINATTNSTSPSGTLGGGGAGAGSTSATGFAGGAGGNGLIRITEFF